MCKDFFRLKATILIGAAFLMALASMTATALAQGGPYERQRVDTAAADRGRALYAKHCINCHGSTAKGTDRGPDLIRSASVLRDRLGNLIGPAIKPGATHQATLAASEIVDLSHFLHQRVEAIARNRNARGPLPVLTGDPEAGRAYFNGAGRCSTCHSPTGDLAGVAAGVSAEELSVGDEDREGCDLQGEEDPERHLVGSRIVSPRRARRVHAEDAADGVLDGEGG